MPAVIINLSATTELEAVNAMLAAVGETPLAPATDLSTATQADVKMALNILRMTTRDVQAMGWKFNTEFGYEVAPTTTYSWVDTAGVTTVLNIFLPPSGLISFKPTLLPEQQGSRLVDVEIRPSRKYTPGTMVFYDRMRARDGLPKDLHAFLYINPVWYRNFEQMPECARRYVVGRAARVFVNQSVGSETLSNFSKQDEALALRTLKREQGVKDTHNWLDNVDARQVHGGRAGWPAGIVDTRRNRGSV